MKKPHIKTLSQALQTGLGVFLITGLTGCTDKDCKDLQYAPQWHVDECKKEQTIIPSSGSSSSHTSSGFFLMPYSSGSYHSTNHSSGG